MNKKTYYTIEQGLLFCQDIIGIVGTGKDGPVTGILMFRFISFVAVKN